MRGAVAGTAKQEKGAKKQEKAPTQQEKRGACRLSRVCAFAPVASRPLLRLLLGQSAKAARRRPALSARSRWHHPMAPSCLPRRREHPPDKGMSAPGRPAHHDVWLRGGSRRAGSRSNWGPPATGDEYRCPAALAIIAAAGLRVAIPARYRVQPAWLVTAVLLALLVVPIARGPGPRQLAEDVAADPHGHRHRSALVVSTCSPESSCPFPSTFDYAHSSRSRAALDAR